MVNRRAFLYGATSMLITPRAAEAQPAAKKRRIGILNVGPTSDMIGPEPRARFVNAFLRGMRELGYVYGRDFVTEHAGPRADKSVSPAWLPSWYVYRWT